jgi:hypothetical protein
MLFMNRFRISLLSLAVFGLSMFLFVEHQVYSQNTDEERLQKAIATLEETSEGKKLIQKVMRVWKLEISQDLVQHLKWGENSRTDTVLTRQYDPKTGVEERKRQMTIFLKQDQSEIELLLDFAHELVHASARPAFDPYDSGLTPAKYIWTAIEGEGGEVDAVVLECQIGFALSQKMKSSIPRCANYIEGSNIRREIVRQDFYRVGDWYLNLKARLGKETGLLPLLTGESPKLYSSTGHTPYPVALLSEFEEITETACTNSRQRIRNVAFNDVSHNNVQLFLQKRCKSIQ